MYGSPSSVFHRKISRLRQKLKNWNWETFGNVSIKKKELLAKVQDLEINLQQGWDDEVHSRWEESRKQLRQVESWERELLCRKARLDWVKDGDRNSKYYHAVIRNRRKRQLTQITLDSGEVTSTPAIIGNLAMEYFASLFSATPYHLEGSLFEGIEPIISDADDTLFSRLPLSDEIKEAIHDMKPSSAPGTEGFTGYFFLTCWEIIQ